MKRRPRPPTIITRVIVFLLLGAIVNVAIGQALWFLYARPSLVTFGRNGQWQSRPSDVSDARAWRRMARPDWPAAPAIVRHQQRSGIRLETMTVFTDVEDALFGQSQQRRLSAFHTVLRVDTGWPMAVVSISLASSSSTPPHNDAWRIGRLDVPSSVIWPGFAINTIFYAAILGLIFYAPGQVRRTIRRRRGLCSTCGYDLRGGTSPVCAECGTPVTRRDAEPDEPRASPSGRE